MGRKIADKTAKEVMAILENVDKVEILGDGRYRIPSQTVAGRMYTVVVGNGAQYCDCLGSRKGYRTCKHIRAAQMFRMLDGMVADVEDGSWAEEGAGAAPERTVLSEDLPLSCTGCLSMDYSAWGWRKTKHKGRVHTYRCKRCGTRFSEDPGGHRLKVHSRKAARVVGTYFDVASYSKTRDHVEREGIHVSRSTVANYVERIVDACLEVFKRLCPAVSDTWSVDDLHIRVNKFVKRYFYCIMDHRSRCLLGLREFKTKGSSDLGVLFRDAKEVAGSIPVILLSDSDSSIAKAARIAFRRRRDGIVSSTFHNDGAHIRGERTDNRQERVERTLAETMRRFGFVTAASNNRARGTLIQYNFCRRHSAIGTTPAEAAGMIVEGDDPWFTLYTHAVWDRIKRGVRSLKGSQKSRKSRKARRREAASKCDKLTRWITGRTADCIR